MECLANEDALTHHNAVGEVDTGAKASPADGDSTAGASHTGRLCVTSTRNTCAAVVRIFNSTEEPTTTASLSVDSGHTNNRHVTIPI